MYRKNRKTYLLFVLSLLVAIVLSGCFGGSSGDKLKPKSYELKITILEANQDKALVGATVEVIGKSVSKALTDQDGQVVFRNLNNEIEIQVQAGGYFSKSQAITMNQNKTITIRLQADAGAAQVKNENDLYTALEDPEITSFYLAEDLNLVKDLVLERPVNLNLNGKKIQGNLTMDFSDEELLEISGLGEITGNLVINAPEATISNYVQVNGSIIINEIGENTWNEYFHNNDLVLNSSFTTVNIYGGAKTITAGDQAWNSVVNILGGQVNQLVINSGIKVKGANQVVLAVVNIEHGVEFDKKPQKLEGYDPKIIESFEPGSGGKIAEFIPSVAPANSFGGLFIECVHKWPYSFTSGSYPEIRLQFIPPSFFGGTKYILQVWDDSSKEWLDLENYTTEDPEQDNFALSSFGNHRIRLYLEDGPFAGYTSNAVETSTTAVNTAFDGWSMGGHSSFVGETITVSFTARTLEGWNSVDTKYLSYQWYRLDPETFELTKIKGATSLQYTLTTADIGSHVMVQATGDELNIGGYYQLVVTAPVVEPNKAFISDLDETGFILNLHKKVPSLTKEDLSLYFYGENVVDDEQTIISVQALDSTNSKFKVVVNMATMPEIVWLEGGTVYWGLVSNYLSEDHPFINPHITYELF